MDDDGGGDATHPLLSRFRKVLPDTDNVHNFSLGSDGCVSFRFL